MVRSTHGPERSTGEGDPEADGRVRPMTLTAKILHDHAIGFRGPSVQAGDLLRIRVDWTIASELAWNGMDRTYQALGRPKIHDPKRFYLAIDHTVDPITLANDPRVKALVKLSREFAKESGIEHFYDANETILHTTFYRDLVRPGDVVLGADSHTSSHGGMSAFSIGLGGADITVAMVLGESWIEVPEAIAVEFSGDIPFGLSGKDVILRTLGELGRNTVAMERSVEYVGDAAAAFTSDMRFTICNMTAEFGGLNGIFPADAVTRQAVEQRSGAEEYRAGLYLAPDEGAPYVARYPIDLAQLSPQLAKPYAPDNVAAVEEELGVTLDGVFIGACNTTEEELVMGALVLEQMLAAGQRPKPSERRLVVPGNREIGERLREGGLLAVYERAGFRVGPPGCSMCLGIASDRAGEGEVWLSSQNRNFRNRMGKGSIAWLGSAATVAASALSLEVSDPRQWLQQVDRDRYARLLGREPVDPPAAAAPAASTASSSTPAASTRDGSGSGGQVRGSGGDPSPGASATQPAGAAGARQIEGRVQRFGDHVDTDAIIPGEFCHLTDFSELGKACFRHVRPEFVGRVAEGRTIVVAGEGWGSGSSREQAVWALQGAGVAAVIARSFAFIHKRNLVNEALPFLVVTDDAFYDGCQEDEHVRLDPDRGTVEVVSSGAIFSANPPSAMIRALSREGGIVKAIRRHGADTFSFLQRG